jgi:hypothetical protein
MPGGSVKNPMFANLVAETPPSDELPSAGTKLSQLRLMRSGAASQDTPWREEDQIEEQVRLFVQAVAAAHLISDETQLDEAIARNLAERVWNYDLAKLHELAAQAGADPVCILQVSSKGVEGLKQCNAKESLIAFLLVRLASEVPPAEAEEQLRQKMAGLGCVRPGCQHAASGIPCDEGCQWDESGVGSDAVERHDGLVKLRELAIAFDVPSQMVFDAVSIQRVKDQKEELEKLIRERAISKLDFFKVQSTISKAKLPDRVPKDASELETRASCNDRIASLN